MENQMVSPPETQTQPISTSPINIPPKKSHLPLILAVIVIFFLSIFGGIALGKYLYGPQTVTPVPTLAPKPTIIPTTIPTVSTEATQTANWKTYTNTKYGYSIKYPTVWSNLISKCTGPDTSNCLDYKGFTGSLDQGFVDLSIYIEKWDSSTSIDELKKDTTTSYLNSVSFNKIIMFISSSKETVSQSNNGPLIYELYVDFLNPDNSLHYLITSSWPKNSKNPKLSETEINSHLLQLNQILSTFKFLDISPTPPTTYTACGCGCCTEATPPTKCLYKSKGEDLNKIIEEDQKVKNSPQCATVGCSTGITYKYCD